MFGREPVVLAAGIAAILQGLLIIFTSNVSAVVPGWELWLTPLITVVAGLFARKKVTPDKKLEEAGISQVEIEDRTWRKEGL